MGWAKIGYLICAFVLNRMRGRTVMQSFQYTIQRVYARRCRVGELSCFCLHDSWRGHKWTCPGPSYVAEKGERECYFLLCDTRRRLKYQPRYRNWPEVTSNVTNLSFFFLHRFRHIVRNLGSDCVTANWFNSNSKQTKKQTNNLTHFSIQWKTAVYVRTQRQRRRPVIA